MNYEIVFWCFLDNFFDKDIDSGVWLIRHHQYLDILKSYDEEYWRG